MIKQTLKQFKISRLKQIDTLDKRKIFIVRSIFCIIDSLIAIFTLGYYSSDLTSDYCLNRLREQNKNN